MFNKLWFLKCKEIVFPFSVLAINKEKNIVRKVVDLLLLLKEISTQSHFWRARQQSSEFFPFRNIK